MNLLEIVFVIISLIIMGVLLFLENKKIYFIFPLISWAIPIYISISHTSQFSDVDGYKRIQDVYWLGKASMEAWEKGAMRTTSAFLGPIASLIRKIPSITEPNGLAILKCLHWLGGFIIILCIYFVIKKYYIHEPGKRVFSFIYPWFLLLMPATITSLKIFKNDLYAMGFAVLSLLIISAAIKERSTHLAIIAIPIAYLGAQEKLNAAPFLVLAIIVLGWLRYKATNKLRNIFLGVVGGFIISIFVGILCFGLVYIVRHGNVINNYWVGITEPFGFWIYPIIMAIIPLKLSGSIFPSFVNAIILPLISALLIFSGASLGYVFDKIKLGNKFAPFIWLEKSEIKIIITLLLLVIIFGVYGTFYVQAYWDPYAPILTGEYHAPSSLNNVTYHYKAFSYLQHMFRSVSFSSSVFMNAIPSIYWVALVIGLLLIIRNRIMEGRRGDKLILFSMLFFSLAFPFMFGILQIPPANKYFNIGLMLFSICSVILLTHCYTYFNKLNSKISNFVIIILPLLLLGEILPFGPVFGGFQPIWSKYPDPTIPELGQVNPSWVGYGEEAMLIGKQIIEECKLGKLELEPESICEDIRLHIYAGDWIKSSATIQIARFPYPKTPILEYKNSKTPSTDYQYTRNDYYLIMRLTAIKGYGFPNGLEPDFIVPGRGFINGWAFRGDRLLAAGYLFYEP